MLALKRFVAALLIALVPLAVAADTLTIPNSFTAGTTIQSSQMNANFTTIATWANGLITNANIKSGALIALSKLDCTAELPILTAAGGRGVSAGVTGDTVPRVTLGTTSGGKGGIFFGAGSASAQDIAFLRKDANTLQVRNAADGAYLNLEVNTITASGGGLISYTISSKSANFTASDNSGTFYRVDTSGGGVTATLDSSVTVGSVFKIQRIAGSNAITITANGGQTINYCGTTGNITLNTGVVEIVRVSGGWEVT